MFAGYAGEFRLTYFFVVCRVQILYAWGGRRRLVATVRLHDLLLGRDDERVHDLLLERTRAAAAFGVRERFGAPLRDFALVERGMCARVRKTCEQQQIRVSARSS